MSTQKKALIAAVAAVLSGSGTAHAVIVGQWIGDNYTSGNWADSSGNGNNGVLFGAAGNTAPVRTNNAFNGHAGVTFAGGTGATATGGFFQVPNGAGQGLNGATAMTLAAVFRPSAAGASSGGQFWQKDGLIGNEQGGAVTDWGLSYGPDLVAGGVGGADTTVVSGAASVPVNTPHVVVWQWNGATATQTLYLDGVQVAQNTTSPTAARTATNTTANFALGSNIAILNGDTKVLNGSVAELRAYNDATVDPIALSNALRATYIPEPGSVCLIAIGAAGLLARRRRRAAS